MRGCLGGDVASARKPHCTAIARDAYVHPANDSERRVKLDLQLYRLVERSKSQQGAARCSSSHISGESWLRFRLYDSKQGAGREIGSGKI